jgi:hypothetical protein
MKKNNLPCNLIFSGIVMYSLISCASKPEWEALGPFSVQNMSGNVVIGGRVDDIQISGNYDGKGNTAMFIACAGDNIPGSSDISGGGIWRSIDFTSSSPTWMPLTDHIPNIPDTRRIGINNIHSISIDPNNPQTIWADAGGLPLALLNSIDGGNNWSLVGQGQFQDSYLNVNCINKVLVDPFGYIWVACNTGFYVSENKGVNFTRIDNENFSEATFDDVVWYSRQSGVFNIYVGVVDHNKNNNQSGIWTVSGVNGKFTWTKMEINLQNIYGLPVNTTLINVIKLYADSKIGVVASISQSEDFLCPDPTGSIWGLLNVFQFDGGIWQPKWLLAQDLVGNEVMGGQVQPICITPDKRIYGGGKGIGVSDGNGGVIPLGYTRGSLKDCVITDENPVSDKFGRKIHVDVHAITYSYADDKIYIGTDGGIVRTRLNLNNPGSVDFWESLNTPSLKNFLSESVALNFLKPNNILAGHQDNGVIHLVSGVIHNLSPEWDYVGGNETDVVFYDPFGTAYFIDCTNQCGELVVSTDVGNNSFIESINLPGDQNNSLLCFHPTQQDRMMIPCHLATPALGKYTVYETTDRWKNNNNIKDLNPPINRYPTAMSYAGNNIYIGSSGQIYSSPDDGSTWTRLWSNAFEIVSICPDQNNPNTLYIATSIKTNKTSPTDPFLINSGRVYYNPDQIKTPSNFQEITGNLPSNLKKLVLYSRGAGKDPILYAATDEGVYRATILNGTDTKWSLFGTGLPDVAITDLQVNPKSHWLYVATYGRGVWFAIDIDQIQ